MRPFHINGRSIGPAERSYIIAEISANHGQRFDDAVKLVKAAKEVGADAVKFQTYTADTMTLNCDRAEFRVGGGTIWDGRTLYGLYQEACTPWDWQPKLQQLANELGLDWFSTPFDRTAVDFLESMNVGCYKIASFELVDLPLVEYVAQKKKPIIMSTGMATLEEIAEAVTVVQQHQCPLALLKCTSAYPAPPESMNLRTIPHLSQSFGVPTGLSDHTLGIAVPVAAIALGASIIEKHFTLSRSDPGPDSSFSLEPHEFREMVQAIRTAEKALGKVDYSIDAHEGPSRAYRRSLFVVRPIVKGECFTCENVASIRPAHGLPPKFMPLVLGRRAARDLSVGHPLTFADLS